MKVMFLLCNREILESELLSGSQGSGDVFSNSADSVDLGTIKVHQYCFLFLLHFFLLFKYRQKLY